MKEFFFNRISGEKVHSVHAIWVYCYKCKKGVTAWANDDNGAASCPFCGSKVA